MVVVADASVAIRGDLSEFRNDLKTAARDTQGLGAQLREALSLKNVLKTGAIFGVGQSIPGVIRQTIGYFGDAAASFSELQQTQRTTNEVFGESAGVIEDWAERAAEAAGMSKQTVFQAASVMGQTLLNMGFDADEAAEKVVTLQQRASEMAIAFGTTPDRAILAITAAMRGERDTIEKFGVSIKQADVNSRVLALGLDTSTAAAKKNSESIAILDLIMEQTSGRAGRFAEGVDDVAVKMAVLQAKIDNFNASIGREVASIQLGALKITDSAGDLWQATNDDFRDFALNFGSQHVEIMRLADEAGVSYETMKQRIINSMDLSGLTFPEVVAQIEMDGSVGDMVEEEWQAGAKAAGAGVAAMANEIKLGGPVVAAEWSVAGALQQIELDKMVAAAKQAGVDGVLEFGSSILNNRQTAIDEVENMVTLMENALSVAETIAGLTGKNTIRELKLGLGSDDEGLRLTAQATLSYITTELNKLGPAGRAAAAALLAELDFGLRDVPAGARLRQAALQLAGIITAPLMRSEPKDPLSPQRGMTHWGRDFIGILADDMTANLGTASAAARELAGALNPSMSVPNMSLAAGGTALATGALGGKTYILNVEGVPHQFGTPREMVNKLEEIGETWG